MQQGDRWVGSKARNALILLGILMLATVPRLYHLGAPIADNLQAKQIYSSNKARNIARAPFDPLRLTLDLLDANGAPMKLAEEVPIYIGMLGALFHVFGESVLWGRLLSIAGSLLAIVALFDLVRREHGERVARVAALLFASMPLFIFYGRAIMPDPWMLAMMLASAASYRRYLDGGGRRWLAAAAVLGALAVLFKYWGLMIVLVLADMTRRARGWRGLWRPEFASLLATIVVPTLLWMALVFARAPNPVETGWVAGARPSPYLVLQQPGALFNRAYLGAFFSRFLMRDCGPVCLLLVLLGLWSALRRRLPDGFSRNSLWAWTIMGLLFYGLLAPKLIDHDYYELMMLPAAATWAALGWVHLAGLGLAQKRLAWGLIALAVIGQSPWVMGGMFRLELGKVELGRALDRHAKQSGRVVALGPGIALAVAVHYSERAGWSERATELPADWPERVLRWREQGAELIGLYFDAKTKPGERVSYQPMIAALTLVEADKTAEYEYIILRLDRDDARRLAARSIGAARVR